MPLMWKEIVVGLVMLIVALTSAACDRACSADPLPVNDPPALESGSEPASVAEPAEQEPQREEETRCQRDSDCDGYLRCMNETCSIPPAISGERDETTPVVRFHVGSDPDAKELARFYVELAISSEEQQRGLMYRRTMLPEWGMLFIYPYDADLKFWMKNTLIPLDMVFVDSSGRVVGVVEGAEPLTLSPRSAGGPARYVLELNAGTAREVGIEAGTWMRMDNVADRHQPKFPSKPSTPP